MVNPAMQLITSRWHLSARNASVNWMWQHGFSQDSYFYFESFKETIDLPNTSTSATTESAIVHKNHADVDECRIQVSISSTCFLASYCKRKFSVAQLLFHQHLFTHLYPTPLLETITIYTKLLCSKLSAMHQKIDH